MRRWRVAVVAFTMASILACVSFVFASDGLICNDPAALLGTQSFEIRVLPGETPNKVRLVFGDLRDQCLPRPMAAALIYVMEWAKTGPRSISGVETTLVLPASGFHLMPQTVNDRAKVIVADTTLRTATATTVGKLTLELIRRDNTWRVLSITAP